ncbi:unnamed protein product [Paramecium octaurelia]|uniref:Uncharacterized protein n=1 Tax=Paramecium octaurelia TaxID=43137 RepID=A0A8S1TEG4_PAROT|nr:unnamed protein product [Paramecium octaurelia]
MSLFNIVQLGCQLKIAQGKIAQGNQTHSACFYFLISRSFQEKHYITFDLKQIDIRVRETQILHLYAIIIGLKIYQKQYEESFRRYISDRLNEQNLKIQILLHQQRIIYQIWEYVFQKFQQLKKIVQKDLIFNFIFVISKILVGMENPFIDVSKLRYLIIDEADQQ